MFCDFNMLLFIKAAEINRKNLIRVASYPESLSNFKTDLAGFICDFYPFVRFSPNFCFSLIVMTRSISDILY